MSNEEEYPDTPSDKLTGKKRKQVKRACGNCRKGHSACDLQRPCSRCQARGLEDSCTDWIPMSSATFEPAKKKRKITERGMIAQLS